MTTWSNGSLRTPTSAHTLPSPRALLGSGTTSALPSRPSRPPRRSNGRDLPARGAGLAQPRAPAAGRRLDRMGGPPQPPPPPPAGGRVPCLSPHPRLPLGGCWVPWPPRAPLGSARRGLPRRGYHSASSTPQLRVSSHCHLERPLAHLSPHGTGHAEVRFHPRSTPSRHHRRLPGDPLVGPQRRPQYGEASSREPRSSPPRRQGPTKTISCYGLAEGSLSSPRIPT
jgi:hypothetical protein